MTTAYDRLSQYSNFAGSGNFETGSGAHSARMALILGNSYLFGKVANSREEVMLIRITLQGQGFIPVLEDPKPEVAPVAPKRR